MTWSMLLRAAQAQANEHALDAEYLLAFVLGRTRAGLYARLSEPVLPESAERFAELWRRRMAGEPYAYLVGEREFFGRNFQVTPSVLIPRPDTECLLEAALARWPVGQEGVLIDAGTGSGALAVSLKLERPTATVLAVDYSAAALRVAQGNARRLHAMVSFWRGDWLAAVHGAAARMVVANPPYLAADDAHLPTLLGSGEPRCAFVAHDQGLADLQTLAVAARRVLSSGGLLLLEHGFSQGAAVRAMLVAQGYAQVFTERDLAGHERISGGQSK